MKKYKEYIIEYCGDPSNLIPWVFCHDEYDGAPDSGDTRCGIGCSVKDCKEQIDELWDL